LTLPQPPLLVITDRSQSRRPLEAVARAAFAAGCRWLSLREKDLSPEARLVLLRRLVAIGRPWQARVGVHEDVAAALAAGAGAVHLPDEPSPAAARAQLPATMLLGISAHDRAGVERAAAAGADYVSLSPIFASASKPGYGPALGLAGLARAVQGATLPIIALGGIDAANARDCIAAGAAGVAVMGAVMAAEDPGAAVSALIASIGAALAAGATDPHSQKR